MNGGSIFFENTSFQSELVKTFESFLSNESFTDVTLVTDDHEQFKAHKIILSARSLFFKQLFIKNPYPHPLIFLRGVTKIDLKKMLEFIYLGKVYIEEERKDVFMHIANDFDLDGFENSSQKPDLKEDIVEVKPSISILDANADIKTFMCQECDSDFTSKVGLGYHVKATHDGASFRCKNCEYQTKYATNLSRHQQVKHNQVRHCCTECEYKATAKRDLKVHVQSVHNGLTYPCDQCKFQATRIDNLRAHVRTIHESIKYFCNICDYRANRQDSLKKHHKLKHDGVKYSCNMCDTTFGWKKSLNAHLQSKHSIQ